MAEHYGPEYSGPEYLRRSFEPHIGAIDDAGTIYSLPDPISTSDHFKVENDGSFPSTSADAFAMSTTAPDDFGFGHLMGLHQPRGMVQPAHIQPLVPQQPGQTSGDDPNAPPAAPVGQSSWSALMKQMVQGR